MDQAGDSRPGERDAAAAGLDRRALLRRVGIGAAVAGAGWVAPQVLTASPAWAGCSPIFEWLQLECSGNVVTQVTTDSDPVLPSCEPSGWPDGVLDTVGWTYTPAAADCRGGTVTITDGCFAVEAKAIKVCPGASSGEFQCVDGILGSGGTTITFPTLPISPTCYYFTFRIKIACCT